MQGVLNFCRGELLPDEIHFDGKSPGPDVPATDVWLLMIASSRLGFSNAIWSYNGLALGVQQSNGPYAFASSLRTRIAALSQLQRRGVCSATRQFAGSTFVQPVSGQRIPRLFVYERRDDIRDPRCVLCCSRWADLFGTSFPS